MFNKNGMKKLAHDMIVLAGKDLHSKKKRERESAEEFFQETIFAHCVDVIGGEDYKKIYKTLKESKTDVRMFKWEQ